MTTDAASNTAVLEAFRGASSIVTATGASLFEQLVGLECAERGRPFAADVVRRLRPMGEEAESQLASSFETDLPSVSLLAQLVAARDAGGLPAPEGSASRLLTAIDTVVRRSAAGLEAKPHLLAAVVRTSALMNLDLKPELKAKVELAITNAADPVAIADLLEASCRIPALREGALRVFESRLLKAHPEPREALAIWWLASRWRDSVGEDLVPDERLEAIRLPALLTDCSGDVIAAAYMTEVTARFSTALRLVAIRDSERVQAAYGRRHMAIYFTLWAVVGIGALAIGLLNLTSLVAHLHSLFASGAPSKGALTTSAVVLFGAIGLAGGTYLASMYRLLSGRQTSPTFVAIGVAIVTLVAAALGALFYPD